LEAGADRPLTELLASLAAQTPAPGGGSASAWTGALAAGLVEMAARFAEAEDAAARATALRAELLASGERELSSYQPVLEAMRLPRNDPSRSERIAAALSDASESPLAIARATAEVAELGMTIAGESKPAIVGDAITGVLLAEAACRSAARLVEINLARYGEDPRVGEAGVFVDRAAVAREQVRENG
jgi:formiminotetrahydrofolate cyclodeaminase